MSKTAGCEVAVRREYDPETTPPSVAVVEALADIKNVAPDSLAAERRVAIQGGIDPDALDALIDDDVEVTFSLGRYQVEVDDEELTVSLR